MKRLQRVSEAEVISEFLKNEFYRENFHQDRDKFERVVLEPDLTDELENSLRRALLFRRRGHLWRELPQDTEWWQVQLEPADLARVRVFPRAQWRAISDGDFAVSEIAKRIRGEHSSNRLRAFISKVQSLSYRLRHEVDRSSVLLIGVDDEQPLTILEGNHRLTAATLVSAELAIRQFRVIVGFSPQMNQSCWYQTNFTTLWRYLKHRVRNFYDREADVSLALAHQTIMGRPLVIETKEPDPDDLPAQAEPSRKPAT